MKYPKLPGLTWDGTIGKTWKMVMMPKSNGHVLLSFKVVVSPSPTIRQLLKATDIFY